MSPSHRLEDGLDAVDARRPVREEAREDAGLGGLRVRRRLPTQRALKLRVTSRATLTIRGARSATTLVLQRVFGFLCQFCATQCV